jgi:hypothetical protein
MPAALLQKTQPLNRDLMLELMLYSRKQAELQGDWGLVRKNSENWHSNFIVAGASLLIYIIKRK